MIFIIDDRQKRQEAYLANFDLKNIENINVFDGTHVTEFKLEVSEGNELKILEGARLVCVHATSLFEETTNSVRAKEHFEQWCLSKKLPIIYFSGGNSLSCTILPKQLYSCDVGTFYRRIGELIEGKLVTEDPDYLLLGKNHLLNKLLLLRRKLFVCNTSAQITEIMKEKHSHNEPVLREVFDQWEKYYNTENIEDWVSIINRQIEKYSEL